MLSSSLSPQLTQSPAHISAHGLTRLLNPAELPFFGAWAAIPSVTLKASFIQRSNPACWINPIGAILGKKLFSVIFSYCCLLSRL